MAMNSPTASSYGSIISDSVGAPSPTIKIGAVPGDELSPTHTEQRPPSPLSPTTTLRPKYARANALVTSIFNKYHNGSARAVDAFVIRCLQEDETRLFSLQCFIEQGPAEKSRERKTSSAIDSAATTTKTNHKANTHTLLHRLFGICGGFGTAGSIMRQWDALSTQAAGREDAMRDYVAVVDKILPGWDKPPPYEYPVAHQDKFWKDDLASDQCQHCGVRFSTVQCRRHHCRMCLDIFCGACCTEVIDMALCPGAPVRRQRVCRSCFDDAEKDRNLRQIRRVMRDNHDLEQRIKDVTATTEAILARKKKDEAKLRQEARQNGCDLREIDAEIERQIGSPVAISVKLPPAHKFAPRETADANDQLALANRQLLMGLKITQCRAKKATENMDVTLRVLREAICFSSATVWSLIIRDVRSLLTLRDVVVLLGVSHSIRRSVLRFKCIAHCVRSHDLPTPTWRAFLWQAQWLTNDKTMAYVADLADAIRCRIDSSSSESDSASDANTDDIQTVACLRQQAVTSHVLVGAHLHPHRRSDWKAVYEFILARCDDRAVGATGEYDAQILRDVGRTFGVSSLRGRASPAEKKNALVAERKSYQRADAATLETPLALRKTALANVLRAFASVNTEIGYCQGMDHVGAVLLSVVDWNESDAFWMLVSLVTSPTYALGKMYGAGLPHLNLRVYQLEQLMAQHLPELHAHIQETDFPVSMVYTSWFMTLFTNMDALSYDLVLRTLDLFAISGWKWIMRVALALLEGLQHHLLASSFDEIPQVFYDVQSIAPQFARAETQPVLARAASFKVTTRRLQELADKYERSGGSPPTSTTSATNTNSATSPPPTTNGSHMYSISRISIPTSTLSANGHANDRSHRAVSPTTQPTIAVMLEPSPNKAKASQNHSAVTTSTSQQVMIERRSRNSSSSSASTSSDSGHKSPDTTRAASPAAFLTPQQLFTAPSTMPHDGLAMPNYY